MEKFLYQEKSLFVENFLDCGKIFSYRKFPWLRKKFCLWKTPMLLVKSILAENFSDQGKTFVCGCPWSRKTLTCGKLHSSRNNLGLRKNHNFRETKSGTKIQLAYLSANEKHFVVDKINIIFVLVKIIANPSLNNNYYS